RFLQAIVTSMPGPVGTQRVIGRTIREVFPVVPLAPGAPLAVGVLGWDLRLYVGGCVDPAWIDDGEALANAIRSVVHELVDAKPWHAAPERLIGVDRSVADGWRSAERAR